MPLTSAMLTISGAEKQWQPDVETRFDRAQQIFVPLDLQVRMQAALHQNAGAAKVDRLLDLLRMTPCGRM